MFRVPDPLAQGAHAIISVFQSGSGVCRSAISHFSQNFFRPLVFSFLALLSAPSVLSSFSPAPLLVCVVDLSSCLLVGCRLVGVSRRGGGFRSVPCRSVALSCFVLSG